MWAGVDEDRFDDDGDNIDDGNIDDKKSRGPPVPDFYIAGGPLGLLTSSFGPSAGRSGRVTHAKVKWHGLTP